MITAFVKWQLDQDISRAEALERFKNSIPVYKGRPGLVRKYICIEPEESYGYGVYLWENREAAEAFYEMASPMIREETGSDPEIQYFDTPIVVDNSTGETLFYD